MNFIPVELRQRLPEFTVSGEQRFEPMVQAYREFYGLDFEKKMSGLSVHMGKTHVAGFDIVIHSYLPRQPLATVFVVHGYYDHVGIYNHLIRALLRKKFAVVAFDLPGHGLSSGFRASISSFCQYQPVLKKVLRLCEGSMPQPWHLVGQSTGGAIIVDYLLGFAGQEERIPLNGVVLLAPLVRPVNWFWNSKLHWVLSPYKSKVKRKFSASSNDEEFLLKTRKNDPLQPRFLATQWVGSLKKWIPFIERHEPVDFPLLIIQGQDDGTVDWRHNIPVLERLFNPVEVKYMAKVRHHVVNELEIYRQDVFSQVVNYLKGKSGE